MPTRTHIGSRHRIVRTRKRLFVVGAGLAVYGAGLAMLVLPGPGILIVFLGLLVLATEYEWADRAVERTRRRAVDERPAARHPYGTSDRRRDRRRARHWRRCRRWDRRGPPLLGISAVLAGLGAPAVLVPATQRLLDRQSASPALRPERNNFSTPPPSS